MKAILAILSVILSVELSAQLTEEQSQYLLTAKNSGELLIPAGNFPELSSITKHEPVQLRHSDTCIEGFHCVPGWRDEVRLSNKVPGATGYEWEFTRTDAPETPIYYLQKAIAPTVKLAALAGLTIGATYDVRIRPVFASGEGQWGPVSCLSIGACLMMYDPDAESTESPLSAVYPNPNTGEMINVTVADLTSSSVLVKITDAKGKVVFEKTYEVEKTFSAIIEFEPKLEKGTYNVSIINGDIVRNERMVVTY